MQTELKEFQKHTAKSNQFYDEKIGELRKLSEKIGNFHPLDEFNKITKKVEISTETANLVRKAIMKNMM